MSKTRVSFKKKVITDLAELLTKVAGIEAMLKPPLLAEDYERLLKEIQELKAKIVDLLSR